MLLRCCWYGVLIGGIFFLNSLPSETLNKLFRCWLGDCYLLSVPFVLLFCKTFLLLKGGSGDLEEEKELEGRTVRHREARAPPIIEVMQFNSCSWGTAWRHSLLTTLTTLTTLPTFFNLGIIMSDHGVSVPHWKRRPAGWDPSRVSEPYFASIRYIVDHLESL